MKYDLSIVIPARNEEWLARTIQDILEHKEAKTEIIAVLDGQWASPSIPQHPDVNIIYVPESVGQRAATNLGVKLSQAKYVAKVDAHTAYDQGFDRKLIEVFEKEGENCIIVPVMRNLHVFDWKCYHCGWRGYQGPKPKECGGCKKGDKLRRKVVWKPRRGIHSTSYAFDAEPHFIYFEDWKHRPQYIKDKEEKRITETMSLQGSFFMATRKMYWKLKLSDESVGNWGNQGIELAGKMWCSGGRVLVYHDTWYAHLFRTQADFGFPYPQSGKHVSRTKKRVWEYFFNGKFKQQIHPISWLVEKFSPVPGWDEAKINELKSREKGLKMV